TGTVTFKNGAAILGTGTLNSQGIATFSTSTLPVGDSFITAVYGGDGNFLGSTSPALDEEIDPRGGPAGAVPVTTTTAVSFASIAPVPAGRGQSIAIISAAPALWQPSLGTAPTAQASVDKIFAAGVPSRDVLRSLADMLTLSHKK